MDVCPVCETPHAREALECATCGHVFHQAAVDDSIVPLAELEPTLAADLAVGVEPTPGLEPTRMDSVPSLPSAPIEGLEPTLAAPQEVAVEPTPDLEPTGLAEEEFPSLMAMDVPCPNCGEIARDEEAFCAKCGMRLPRAGPQVEVLASQVICTSCGGERFAGGVCSRCGVRAPSAD